MEFFNHTLRYQTLRGGIGIENPNANDNGGEGVKYGTIGFIATDGTTPCIVSCYHVLCRMKEKMPKNVDEQVFNPLDLERSQPLATIRAEWGDRDLDCAAARVLGMPVVQQVLGIGKLGAPAQATVGMRVLKSSATTGVTEGHITNVTMDEITIDPVGMPKRYQLTEGGDSGALWVDADTHAPVGLHFKADAFIERAFARPIQAVLDKLKVSIL